MTDPLDLTLEEKASLASGADFWNTKTVRDIRGLMLTDGPHGLRKQGETADHLGVAMSLPATCFPPAAGLSQSWNTELVSRIGVALGRECSAADVSVLLGPGVNIKRHPLGGRNFEYFSEDPNLSGALGTAWVKGLQSQGVGASVKHFAANNQETDRHRVSSDIDPRTLREIYLRAFQRVVEEAQPWTVMCAYNAINGVSASENEFLLSSVLRDDWGFEGVVVSDWGAVAHRVPAARAGLDLEMPPTEGSDDELVAAVRDGSLPESVLDRIAVRVSALAAKAEKGRSHAATFDVEEHHALAREAATQSIVLLKNDGGLLPIPSGASVAVIGEAAAAPRFQGGGSSFVNTTRLDVPLDEMRRIGGTAVTYAAGYSSAPSDAGTLVEEAVAHARAADIAVLFLAPAVESEGFDRDDMELPPEQIALAEAVHGANPNTVVVLARGGALRLGSLGHIPAILDGALLGQGIGHAIAEILYGVANPSGRLSETLPQRLEETPAFGNFPGEHGHVLYGEGLLVGYRWYDARSIPVDFPFGHGLSYTTFEYSNLILDTEGDDISASVTLTNSGTRAGREVPQFYVSVPDSKIFRALRELKGFASVELAPGESVTTSVLLRRSDLAYWDIRGGGQWTLEDGEYLVSVGASSRDIRAVGSVNLTGDTVAVELSLHSTIGELLANPLTGPFMANALTAAFGSGDNPAVGGNVVKMISPSPLHSVMGLLESVFNKEEFEQLLVEANTGDANAAARSTA